MQHKHNEPSWKAAFAVIYTGQAFSLIGSSAAQFAILWYLTARTASPLVLSFAGLVGFLPQALLGPFAGVWVDRLSRKRVMMASDGFVALASAILIGLSLTSEPTVGLVCAILFLRALGSVFHSPAMQAAIPMLVPPEHLLRAGGWGQMILSISLMAGPVLGAGMITLFGLSGAMLIDVVGALTAVGSLAFIRLPDPPAPEGRVRVLAEMRAGYEALRANRAVAAITLPVVMSCMLYAPLNTLFPLLVLEHFGKSAWHSGLVETVFAAGMVLASLLLGLFGGKNPFRMICWALLGLGLMYLASGLLPRGGFWIFVLLCTLMGVAGNFIVVPYTATLQRHIPPEHMGKVMSLVFSVISLSTPVGLLLAGPGAARFGTAGWFAIIGGIMTAVGALSFVLIRRVERGG